MSAFIVHSEQHCDYNARLPWKVSLIQNGAVTLLNEMCF